MNRTFVFARLLEKIGPVQRGERFEEPLDQELKRLGLGECDGGGTMQAKSGEIEWLGLDIHLADVSRGVPAVIAFLESRGVAAGSVLEIDEPTGKREIVFGKIEGVGLYLDGVNLPDEVYKTSDVNFVIEEIEKTLGRNGRMRAFWEGQRETALYFYGPDATLIEAAIKPLLESYPLCRGARVVSLTPRNEAKKAEPGATDNPGDAQ